MAGFRSRKAPWRAARVNPHSITTGKRKQHFEEYLLSCAVNKRLEEYRRLGLLDCVFFHVPNRAATPQQRIMDAAMGVKAGCHDFVFQRGDFGAQIELKTKRTTLRDSQVEFGQWLDGYGVRRAVCRSVEQVEEALRAWGCLRG